MPVTMGYAYKINPIPVGSDPYYVKTADVLVQGFPIGVAKRIAHVRRDINRRLAAKRREVN